MRLFIHSPCPVVQVLVDGPFERTGVSRQVINVPRLILTGIKIKIPRSPRAKKLKKEFDAADVIGKWEQSSLAKRIASRRARANTTDFDRFKIMVAKKQVCISMI